jgi:hypothetical protein
MIIQCVGAGRNGGVPNPYDTMRSALS